MAAFCWNCAKKPPVKDCVDCYCSRVADGLMQAIHITPPTTKRWLETYERSGSKFDVRIEVFHINFEPTSTPPEELLEAYIQSLDRMTINDNKALTIGRKHENLRMITVVKPKGPKAEVVGPEVPLAKVVEEEKGF